MARHGFVRTLYLYIFALLGLIFTSIGAIRFLDMGLRAFVFRQADAMERYDMPPVPTMARLEREAAAGVAGDTALTPEERRMLKQAIEDYKRWREQRDRVNPVTARRQREASTSLAMILVGLPLYLYHWRTIRREAEERRRLAAERRATQLS